MSFNNRAYSNLRYRKNSFLTDYEYTVTFHKLRSTPTRHNHKESRYYKRKIKLFKVEDINLPKLSRSRINQDWMTKQLKMNSTTFIPNIMKSEMPKIVIKNPGTPVIIFVIDGVDVENVSKYKIWKCKHSWIEHMQSLALSKFYAVYRAIAEKTDQLFF